MSKKKPSSKSYVNVPVNVLSFFPRIIIYSNNEVDKSTGSAQFLPWVVRERFDKPQNLEGFKSDLTAVKHQPMCCAHCAHEAIVHA